MRLDSIVKICSPNTTSRSFMTDVGGLKCVHYGDIYKNYTDRKIASSNIINAIAINFPEHRILRQNAIIIADVSETLDDWGHVTFIKFDGTPYINGTHTFAIINDCATTLKYLFYYLRDETNRKRLRQFLTGVTVFQMSIKSLSKYKIDIPPLPTQTHIADILSAYDNAIENNNRRIALLEKAARELYHEWFVRMRFPGHESAKVMNGLPEGWEVKRLRDFGQIKTGKTPPTENKENYGDEIMFVKTPDMHGEVFVISTAEYLSKKGHLTQQKKLLPANSIMVSCIGTGGVVAINADEAHTNQQINSIVLKNKLYLGWLYFTCLNLKETIELFGVTGTTMTNLSKGKFERLKVLQPPQSLIEAFQNKVADSLLLIKNRMKQNQNLARQRDLLLPRLMSGKLEV